VKDYNIDYFFFADDTFTANTNHTIEICREIRRRNLKIFWDAEVRANTVTECIVKEMVKAGCMHVQIGAESGDNEILSNIGKGVTIDTIENAVMCFLKYDITVVCSFILGHPDDTLDTLDKTIKFAVRIKNLAPGQSKCKFSFLTPLPGTPVFENREALGLKLLSDNWDRYTFNDPICETKYLTKKELRNAYMEAWKKYAQE
jgi:radical SAM superfamily enzyme YgiQ (UPF0313 family)